MIKKITHRFGWKVLSVMLAFLLWLLVVNYENPIITYPYTLTVEKQNETAITSQNKAIEYKGGQTVDITVKGKRTIIDGLSKSDLKAYVDLSKLSITNATEILFKVPDGVTVIYKNPAAMTIGLQNIIKAQKQVQYIFDGVPADNFIELDPIITPNIIQITGPESQVNQVSSVTITISIEGAKKDITLFATPQLWDNNQNVVSDVKMNVDRVSVMIPIQKTKTIPIIVSDVVDLTAGYVITRQVQDINKITIRGTESAVDAINSVTIGNVSLENVTEDTSLPINIDDYLDDSVVIINNDGFMKLDYTIRKLEEKIITVQSQDIIIKNIPEGLEFSYDDDLAIDLVIKGIQSDLDQVTLESLSPNIRLFELLPGEQEVELFYTLPPKVVLTSDPPLLNITLVEKEVLETP